jgi:hypothetical protein
MKYYFLFDFYLQSDKGLIDLISESGFESIDPWEDLAEDVDFLVSYFFGHFQLEILKKNSMKIKENYIARFLVSSEESFEVFVLNKRLDLEKLRKQGWAPYSTAGRPFIIASLDFSAANALFESNNDISQAMNIQYVEFQ